MYHAYYLIVSKTLNALNQKMAEDISSLREADKNEEVGCIIITGSEKHLHWGQILRR